MEPSERIEKSKKILLQNAKDGLALYALAMEYNSRGDFTAALDYLDHLLKIDPTHVPGYYQKALIHVKLSQNDEAKSVLEAGLPKAAEAGHLHTRDKMRELLEAIDK
ncbi:MAG: tetratricopeptide repeat protein [Phycisphaerae bacterium]